MIIEGKHADIGSGIFVSDIQANSVADLVTTFDKIHFFNQPVINPFIYSFARLESFSVTSSSKSIPILFWEPTMKRSNSAEKAFNTSIMLT